MDSVKELQEQVGTLNRNLDHYYKENAELRRRIKSAKEALGVFPEEETA